ncbi:MAG: hypothetical protein JO001_17470 [Alphaproteobacteria bacterium]|nr:hypothetical protein [Alphaproteobacteria bacterium]
MPDWEEIDFSRFVFECQKVGRAPREVREYLEGHGVVVLPVDQYTPIPLLSEMPESFEGSDAAPNPVYARLFDRELLGDYIRGMTEFAGEFAPMTQGDVDNAREFFWENPLFSFSDAMAYYCFIRMRKPQRIVEIGGSFSTLVASAAIEKNGFGEIICIDAAPRPFVGTIPHLSALVQRKIQHIGVPEFQDLLGPASMLFIDSTHTVKIGSDSLYIYLVLLPSLSRNLLVQSHDIYLPFGMPQAFSSDHHIHWNEQYLLYAYLLANSGARILYGSNYAAHFLADELTTLMAGKYAIGGASLWYEINRPLEIAF